MFISIGFKVPDGGVTEGSPRVTENVPAFKTYSQVQVVNFLLIEISKIKFKKDFAERFFY